MRQILSNQRSLLRVLVASFKFSSVKEQKQQIPTTINYHLTEKCNYRCKFCFGNYDSKTSIKSLSDCLEIIKLIAKEHTFQKINFAGGEPLLSQFLSPLLHTAREQGLKTSIISNGSLITKEWIRNNGPLLHQLGISCDSANEETSLQLGRGYGKHVQNVKKVFQFAREYNASIDKKKQMKTKLNTVVTLLNCNENMADFVCKLGVQRWKIFQILLIKGSLFFIYYIKTIQEQNDKLYSKLAISENQFKNFLKINSSAATTVTIVPEFNKDMLESYLMINPSGCFYQNTNNQYKLSEPILKIGVCKALEQVGYSYETFIQRGGIYTI